MLKNYVRHHKRFDAATRTMISCVTTVSGPSSIVNPIYENGCLTEPVPKSDFIEFELPFGIDEEELQIRSEHNWTGGEKARLYIRMLHRMKQRQEQYLHPNDLTNWTIWRWAAVIVIRNGDRVKSYF